MVSSIDKGLNTYGLKPNMFGVWHLILLPFKHHINLKILPIVSSFSKFQIYRITIKFRHQVLFLIYFNK